MKQKGLPGSEERFPRNILSIGGKIMQEAFAGRAGFV